MTLKEFKDGIARIFDAYDLPKNTFYFDKIMRFIDANYADVSHEDYLKLQIENKGYITALEDWERRYMEVADKLSKAQKKCDKLEASSPSIEALNPIADCRSRERKEDHYQTVSLEDLVNKILAGVDNVLHEQLDKCMGPATIGNIHDAITEVAENELLRVQGSKIPLPQCNQSYTGRESTNHMTIMQEVSSRVLVTLAYVPDNYGDGEPAGERQHMVESAWDYAEAWAAEGEKTGTAMTPEQQRIKEDIKVGDIVLLDAEYNNASQVKVVRLTPSFLFAEIRDEEGSQWEVMAYRLTKLCNP